MITKDSVKDIDLRIIDIIIPAFLFLVIAIVFALVSAYIFYPGYKNFPTSPDLFLADLLGRPFGVLLLFSCIILLLYSSTSLILPIVWIKSIRRVSLSAIGLKRVDWIKNFAIGTVVGFLFYFIWAFIAYILHTILTMPAVTDNTRLLSYFYWPGFIATVIIAPIGESVWVIGLIFHALLKKMDIHLASVITSLIFVLMHIGRVEQSYFGVLILFGYFTNIYIQIWLYRKRESLFAPIGFHMVYNIIGFLR